VIKFLKKEEIIMIDEVGTIKQKLSELMEKDKTVESLVVVSKDGLPISSTLPLEEEEKTAAVSASLIMLGEKAIEDFKRGTLEEIITRGTEGYIIIVSLNQSSALLAVLNKEAKLGLIRLELKALSKSIMDILGGF